MLKNSSQPNPFRRPRPLEQSMLRELAQTAAYCWKSGWLPATAGNFSLRALRHPEDPTECFWMSPSGTPKNQLKPSQFIAIDSCGETLRPDKPRCSEETPVHLAIYKLFPEANCIVHAHPPSIVKATMPDEPRSNSKDKPLRQSFSFSNAEMLKAFGYEYNDQMNVTIMPNEDRASIASVDQRLLSFAHKQGHFVVFANHGVYAWGSRPMQALHRMEALEALLCSFKN